MCLEKAVKNKIDSKKDFLSNYSNGIKFQLVLELDIKNHITIDNYINHIDLLLQESKEANQFLLELQTIVKNHKN